MTFPNTTTQQAVLAATLVFALVSAGCSSASTETAELDRPTTTTEPTAETSAEETTPLAQPAVASDSAPRQVESDDPQEQAVVNLEAMETTEATQLGAQLRLMPEVEAQMLANDVCATLGTVDQPEKLVERTMWLGEAVAALITPPDNDAEMQSLTSFFALRIGEAYCPQIVQDITDLVDNAADHDHD